MQIFGFAAHACFPVGWVATGAVLAFASDLPPLYIRPMQGRHVRTGTESNNHINSTTLVIGDSQSGDGLVETSICF